MRFTFGDDRPVPYVPGPDGARQGPELTAECDACRHTRSIGTTHVEFAGDIAIRLCNDFRACVARSAELVAP